MSEGNGHLKLNIGSGDRAIMKGYVNVDARYGDAAYPLEYGDSVVDEIYASHILEHFGGCEVPNVLRDWVRALRPGGVLKVAVPNFKWIAEQYIAGNPNMPLGGYLMGGQTDQNDFHKSVFDESILSQALGVAGLVDIQPWQSEIQDCASLPVSLNLMGRKPARMNCPHGKERDISRKVTHSALGPIRRCACCQSRVQPGFSGEYCLDCHPAVDDYPRMGEQVAQGNIPPNGLQYVAGAWRDKSKMAGEMVKIRPGLVISRPRYGPLDAAEAIYEIAIGIHAPMFKSLGCWRGPRKDRAIDLAMDYRMEWDEGLSDAVEQALHHSDPLDVIVTVDFDTYATPDDAKELIRLLYQNPQYDCVVSTQVRRGHYQEILANFAETPDFSQALVPIITGHFGLTVFRRHVFERMRKPWFLSRPDADGGWGEGRTDADIYFWNHFCDQGFKAALATTVVVGHGDEAVCWPKIQDGKIVKVWQSLTEWLVTRKPPV